MTRLNFTIGVLFCFLFFEYSVQAYTKEISSQKIFSSEQISQGEKYALIMDCKEEILRWAKTTAFIVAIGLLALLGVFSISGIPHIVEQIMGKRKEKLDELLIDMKSEVAIMKNETKENQEIRKNIRDQIQDFSEQVENLQKNANEVGEQFEVLTKDMEARAKVSEEKTIKEIEILKSQINALEGPVNSLSASAKTMEEYKESVAKLDTEIQNIRKEFENNSKYRTRIRYIPENGKMAEELRYVLLAKGFNVMTLPADPSEVLTTENILVFRESAGEIVDKIKLILKSKAIITTEKVWVEDHTKSARGWLRRLMPDIEVRLYRSREKLLTINL